MIVILCLDDKNGMMFNHRRQSRDREVTGDILQMRQGKSLWMNAYSAKLFKEEKDEICVAEDFLARAKKGEYCFVEDRQIRPFVNEIEGIVLYRWNRKYPADVSLDFDFDGWELCESVDFAGNSHEKLTKERYIKKV